MVLRKWSSAGCTCKWFCSSYTTTNTTSRSNNNNYDFNQEPSPPCRRLSLWQSRQTSRLQWRPDWVEQVLDCKDHDDQGQWRGNVLLWINPQQVTKSFYHGRLDLMTEMIGGTSSLQLTASVAICSSVQTTSTRMRTCSPVLTRSGLRLVGEEGRRRYKGLLMWW